MIFQNSRHTTDDQHLSQLEPFSQLLGYDTQLINPLFNTTQLNITVFSKGNTHITHFTRVCIHVLTLSAWSMNQLHYNIHGWSLILNLCCDCSVLHQYITHFVQ